MIDDEAAIGNEKNLNGELGWIFVENLYKDIINDRLSNKFMTLKTTIVRNVEASGAFESCLFIKTWLFKSPESVHIFDEKKAWTLVSIKELY